MIPHSDTPTLTSSCSVGVPPAASRWSKLQGTQVFTRYAALALAGSLCAAAAPFLPFSNSYLRLGVDLAGHFVWAYLGVGLVITAVSKTKARWFAAASVLVSAAVVANAYWSSETPTVASIAKNGLHVLSANVRVDNQSPARLLQLLAKQKPDLVFVQEVSPAFAAALDKLATYPYRKVVPRHDSFGIALLSKYPLEDVEVLDEGEFDIPTISATLTWEGTKVAVRAVHPFPPTRKQAYVDRNRLLTGNAAALAATGRPALMAGDFNATPWSAGVSVVQEAGLVRATSLAPTWPAHLPGPALVPIDHIAVSKHWGVLSNGRGPDIGSDHFPVEATLYLK